MMVRGFFCHGINRYSDWSSGNQIRDNIAVIVFCHLFTYETTKKVMRKKSKLCPESGLQGIQPLRIKKYFMCIINNSLAFDNNIIAVFSLKNAPVRSRSERMPFAGRQIRIIGRTNFCRETSVNCHGQTRVNILR